MLSSRFRNQLNTRLSCNNLLATHPLYKCNRSMPTIIRSTLGLPDWLRGLQVAIYEQQPCVLITLVKTQGSVPREVGARMLMTAQACCGTIGGGRLEWQASKRARQLLTQPQAISSIEVFTLGPHLDQCCGGVASVHYEYFPLADIVWFETLLARWQQGLSTTLRSYPQVWPHTGRGRDLVETHSDHGIQLLEPEAGKFYLIESFFPSPAHLVIFGAGHVAQALVQILLPLDWHIHWVDNRAELFPSLPAGQASLSYSVIDPAVFALEQVPADSFCLIMTHEHSLDLDLCAELLARSDLAYVGLIGSATKAARFRKRLLEQGLSAEQVARLVCPIGIRGIQSKQPAAIAISIAAQLLQLREKGIAASGDQIS